MANIDRVRELLMQRSGDLLEAYEQAESLDQRIRLLDAASFAASTSIRMGIDSPPIGGRIGTGSGQIDPPPDGGRRAGTAFGINEPPIGG